MSEGQSHPKARRFPLQLDQVARKTPTSRGAGTPSKPSTQGAPSGTPRELLRPQAPLHQAEQDRRRHAAPSGIGLDSVHVRRRMVQRLMAEGVSHAALLDILGQVPRHLFVDTALVNQAYEDTSLPIGLGQTISKPSVVAAMIQLLCERPGRAEAPVQTAGRPLGACLEIGTGCGYQAAVLAGLARRLVSVERLKDLHQKARANLDGMRAHLPHWPDVRLVYGDGMLGHAPQAPYDTIIAAAGGAELPQAWLDQLAPGGRLVAPMENGRPGAQVLAVVDRLPDGSLRHSRAGAVLFVPLKSGIT